MDEAKDVDGKFYSHLRGSDRKYIRGYNQALWDIFQLFKETMEEEKSAFLREYIAGFELFMQTEKTDQEEP